MKAYTFIGGQLFPCMALSNVKPPMMMFGRLDIHEDHIAGDCAIMPVDADNLPVFIDSAQRLFSEASYTGDFQENRTAWCLHRDRGFPDDKVLVHIRTCGPDKGILGRWDILGGEPYCLVRGFGVDGPPLFSCSELTYGDKKQHKVKSAKIYTAGKWNEGLLVFSPGDSVIIIPQRPDHSAYIVEYSGRQGLRSYVASAGCVTF